MKTKSTNKLVSLALALFMLLMSVPFSMFATTVRAEEASETAKDGVYVLDSTKDLPEVKTKGDMATAECNKDGIVTAGTEDFFKLHVDKDTRFDSSTKSFDDGYSGTQRINFNVGINTSDFSNSIEFTIENPATVSVWWVHPKEQRQMAVYAKDGTQVAISPKTTDLKDNAVQMYTFELDKAGTYFIGGTPKAVYFYKVEVTEHIPQTYTLDSTKDLPEVKTKGDMATAECNKDGIVTAGTEDFFKLHVDKDTRFDSSTKSFDDGYSGTQRINFNVGINTSDFSNSIEFTVSGAATVSVWWVHPKEQRQMAVYAKDGTQVAISPKTTDLKDNAVQMYTFELDKAGTYFIGGTPKAVYFYKVEVTVGAGKVERGDWTKVEAPVITEAKDDGEGNIVVKVTADVSDNGGDAVVVTMTDAAGEKTTKQSLKVAKDHELEFTPKATGKYTFTAELTRDGEEAKATAASVTADFVLPLGTPSITSATSKGNGTVEVVWAPVDEATEYEVFVGDKSQGTTKDTTFMVKGLEVGKEYSITVLAKRGTETGEKSKASTVKTTQEEQMTWGFMYYGTSTEAANSDNTSGNGVIGDLNADKKITLFSLGNKGKFNEKAESDGLAFYYTAIPTSKNFTLRAKIHVDSWTLSGQEGIAVMAIDSLPGNGYSAPNSTGEFYSNFYRAGALRFAYKYDSVKGLNDTEGDTYNMYLGIGIQSKTGIVKENLEMIYNPPKGVTVDKNDYMDCGQYALETLAAEKGLGQGKYDTIGNCTNTNTFDNDAVANITDFIIELQRNNTGYFISYYTDDGTLVRTQKFYDPKALDQLDSDYVYVGFAAARAMKATISDVTVKTIDPKDDDPAEERPVEKIEPKVSFASSSIANAPKYDILLKANVKGSATIIVGGKPIIIGLAVDGTDEYTSYTLDIAPGTNKIEVKFTPDADQELPEYTELSTTDAVTFTLNVAYNTYFEKQNNIYVAPNGTKNGNGSKEYPLDIYTAVKVARPGQTIILMNGTYKLEDTLTIERSIKGTKDKMITMIGESSLSSSSTNAATAAAAAATKTERPVLDFQGKAGMVAVGDYWYFKGFDVTNSKGGTPGVLVSGSYCTYDDIKAYANGDCGIYIRSKGNSADPKSLYPSYNLILNCEAYNNADPAGGNGDGFGAKETVGVGNIFDGCVAHNNGDDGWDLFARGKSIESVTIKNCIAFENGHNADGTIKGDGNGFKMGGNSLAGGHKIINSIAFNNDQNGITCNSCPDIEIYNCISFNNGGSNVALYTGNKKLETAFKVEGVISFRKDTTGSEKLEPQTQKVDDLKGANNYYWEGKSVNNAGKEITADMFESLTYSGYSRAADGKLILNDGFLALKEGTAPEELLKLFVSLDGNYGDDYANSDIYTVRGSVTITEDDPDDLPSPSTGFGIAIVVAVIAISAAAAIVLFKKRKSSK